MQCAVPHQPLFFHPLTGPPAALHHVTDSCMDWCKHGLHQAAVPPMLPMGRGVSTTRGTMVHSELWGECTDRQGHWSLGSLQQQHNNMEEKQNDRRWYHRDIMGLWAAVVTSGSSGMSCVIQVCTWLCTVWTCLQSITQTCPKSNFCVAASPGLHSIQKKSLNYITTTGCHKSRGIEELLFLYRDVLPKHLPACFLLVACMDLYILYIYIYTHTYIYFKNIYQKTFLGFGVEAPSRSTQLPLLSSCNIITRRYKDTEATIQM